VSVFGRALSLPTTCTAKAMADGGDASCDDGVSLSWRRYEAMEEATETLASTLAALGEEEAVESFSCTVAGEVARCALHRHAVAGLTYLDGKPLAILCIGTSDPRSHSLCRALILPR
jgi:hypothetical protein